MKKSIYSVIHQFTFIPAMHKGTSTRFSTAGFFRLADSGRDVYSMNPAWRFL